MCLQYIVIENRLVTLPWHYKHVFLNISKRQEPIWLKICQIVHQGQPNKKRINKFSGQENFYYIGQLFVYKTRLWTQLCTRSRYGNVRPLYAFVFIRRSFQTVRFFSQASCLFTKRQKCKQKIIRHFHTPSIFTIMNCGGLKIFLVIGNFKKLDQ